jgi:hypothetical protein
MKNLKNVHELFIHVSNKGYGQVRNVMPVVNVTIKLILSDLSGQRLVSNQDKPTTIPELTELGDQVKTIAISASDAPRDTDALLLLRSGSP